MSKKSAKLRQDNPGNLYILPIAFVITIVPLIVFMKLVNLSPIEVKNWYGEPTYTDFFNYYKSQWLIIGTVMAVIFYLVHSLIKGFELKKSFFYIPTAIYAALIILSTIFSKNPQIALKGFVARYEGMMALLCYLALMVITYNLVRHESQIKFLLGALLVSASVIGVIGVFQFVGLDLFRSTFGKQLILPEAFHQAADGLSFRFEKNAVYSTFSNTNYIGSYMALLIPLAFVSIFYLKKPYLKAGSALLTTILIINLFGSRSRAGLVGLGVSVLLAIILFRKAIFKRKLLVAIVTGALIILFFGMNYVLKGALTDRILSEFTQDSKNEVQFFDLQDILMDEKSVSIVSATETLVIKMSEESRLYFYNAEDKALEYDMTDNADDSRTIAFTDPQYKDYGLVLKGNVITINHKQAQFKLRGTEDSFKLIGINGDETNEIEKPASFGFAGNERLGSARGYIWSRSLPMLKKAVLVGYGPDTYAIEFPQNDYIGKIRAYGTAQMVVDKPHDLYLQIALNTGALSLIIVLALWGFYVVQSIKLYTKNIDNSFLSLSGATIFIAVCGYLAAGFFNDSVVGVAPIFWVLLGLGFVCNGVVSSQRNKVGIVK